VLSHRLIAANVTETGTKYSFTQPWLY